MRRNEAVDRRLSRCPAGRAKSSALQHLIARQCVTGSYIALIVKVGSGDVRTCTQVPADNFGRSAAGTGWRQLDAIEFPVVVYEVCRCGSEIYLRSRSSLRGIQKQ